MEKEKKNRQMIGLRAEPELCAIIEQRAAAERRSVSGFIRNVLCEYIEATSNRSEAA